MTKSEVLRDLRTALVDLYPDEADAIRVAEDAGLYISRIQLGGSAINNWRNILAEAQKQGLVEALVTVACTEYPRNYPLVQAERSWLKTTSAVAPASGAAPPTSPVAAPAASSAAAQTPPAPILEEKDVDLAVLAELLQAAYTADDLRRFCLYRPQFREVLDGLPARPSLVDLVDEVVVFSVNRLLLGDLLREVEAERPRRYAQFKDRLYRRPDPPDPGGPSQKPPQSSGQIKWAQKARLVQALLSCPTVSDRGKRDTVLVDLLAEYSFRFDRSANDQVDVANLVNAALQYPGALETFVEMVRFYEGNSIGMQAVDQALALPGN